MVSSITARECEVVQRVTVRLLADSERPEFDRLIKERSVLITPGNHFGVGRYIRVGFGYDVDYTLRGLARVDLTIEDLKKKRTRPKSARLENTRRGAA